MLPVGRSLRELVQEPALLHGEGAGTEQVGPPVERAPERLGPPPSRYTSVVTRGDVRRAKLYYLRDRVGKAAKVKEKRV